jgi:hypothetical protein
MAHLKTVVEGTWEDEGEMKTDRYYLLHWGMKYDLIPDANGNLMPVQYTVGICQHIKTGNIELFLPDLIKVLGVNVKEE